MTVDLSEEIPELFDVLTKHSKADALFIEVVEDLKKVSALLEDLSIPASERAEWTHIRSELVNELRRMVKRNPRSISD